MAVSKCRGLSGGFTNLVEPINANFSLVTGFLVASRTSSSIAQLYNALKSAIRFLMVLFLSLFALSERMNFSTLSGLMSASKVALPKIRINVLRQTVSQPVEPPLRAPALSGRVYVGITRHDERRRRRRRVLLQLNTARPFRVPGFPLGKPGEALESVSETMESVTPFAPIFSEFHRHVCALPSLSLNAQRAGLCARPRPLADSGAGSRSVRPVN
jgi:hypothetical protein